ncbi:MAG TPA: pyrimidine/purine nucleoside phosphorylase [Candidatus Cloacimonadota bacterium]|nr:pyrimidine/purine nucleoside phosphorylase [Candidatus Cloacimonadota bacterium]HPT72971.1 pyrimidine/purine nucleoside phosphorylase [Candidatus Cloacimonadota bacterium]
MLKANEYFEGKVRSIAFENLAGNATVGVMDIGEYEFGTTSVEHMTVVSGELLVKLPGEVHWQSYCKGETFVVEAHQKFQLQVKEQTAYVCFYT